MSFYPRTCCPGGRATRWPYARPRCRPCLRKSPRADICSVQWSSSFYQSIRNSDLLLIKKGILLSTEIRKSFCGLGSHIALVADVVTGYSHNNSPKASQHHSITASQHHSITASQHHSITASQHHSITASDMSTFIDLMANQVFGDRHDII
jgi:hypothetical protein